MGLQGPALGHQLTRSCASGLGPDGPELALPGCLLSAHTAQGPRREGDWLVEGMTPAWAPWSVTTMILPMASLVTQPQSGPLAAALSLCFSWLVFIEASPSKIFTSHGTGTIPALFSAAPPCPAQCLAHRRPSAKR